MDGDEDARRSGPVASTPARVSLARLVSPSPRRLSSRFARRQSPPTRRKIAWVSLQGRLVGAEEATSASAIGGGLSSEEAVAWTLFSPLHRVLVVAVVAVAACNSKKARKIAELQRSVDLRDEVLQSMQRKLDDICEQMNYLQDQPVECISGFSFENNQFDATAELVQGASQFCCSRTTLPELNPESGIAPLCKTISAGPHAGQDFTGIDSAKDEVFNTVDTITMEQEERRMSDLSDFNWSVVSSVDFQLSTLAAEQEYYNLRKECKEKDEKIKELTSAADASRVAGSKRIMELEEIIRRKNMVISKLKKDMAFLEKQVIQLTRLRRGSCAAASNSINLQPPVMANNILYDMSSTSPSSSDPDSPVTRKQSHHQNLVGKDSQRQDIKSTEIVRQSLAEHLIPFNKSTESLSEKRSISPLKENRRIQKSESVSSLRQRRLSYSSEDSKSNRRAPQQEANCTSAKRRWS